MAVVTMRQLLESGVHFGHQTRRWNPKMEPYILTERNGIYIIDLQQTLADIDIAYEFVKQTVARGGTVLFVGTKKQAQEAIQEQALRVGMPYVNHRWLGGMLTNFSTVSKRLQRLKELEQVDFEDSGTSGFTKKELLMKRREKDKLSRTLGGIRDMGKLPSAVWVVDTLKEHLAVAEARKLNIPVIAILDTNSDPEEVDYGIPGNDDAIRAAGLLTRVIADGVAEGLLARSAPKKGEATAADVEPLAEWERELLEASKNETEKADFESSEAFIATTESDTKRAQEMSQAAAKDEATAVAEAAKADEVAVALDEAQAKVAEVPADTAAAVQQVELEDSIALDTSDVEVTETVAENAADTGAHPA